jgi:hypothetical protein
LRDHARSSTLARRKGGFVELLHLRGQADPLFDAPFGQAQRLAVPRRKDASAARKERAFISS